MRLKSLVNLFRASLFFLAVFLLYRVLENREIPNWVFILNDTLPHTLPLRALDLRLEYFLYLPNVVLFLGFLLGAVCLLELKQRFHPDNTDVKEDWVTGGACLAVALCPPFLMGNAKEGILQLLIFGTQVIALWLFMVLNASPYVLNRHFFNKPWVRRFLDWTFPASDLIFYMAHRKRFGSGTGALRFFPTVQVIGLLALPLGVEGYLLWNSRPAQKVNIPIITSSDATLVDGGVWATNTNWYDAKSGIWYYDEKTRIGRPAVRAIGLRKFSLSDGALYYCDRFDQKTYKVDAKTRRVFWSAQGRGTGSPVVIVKNGLVYVFREGHGGYAQVLNQNGTVLAEREFALGAQAPQVLRNGDVAFLDRAQRLQIWDSHLAHGEIIELPLPQDAIRSEYTPGSKRVAGFSVWSDYDDRSDTLFVNEFFWGEIFRFDVSNRRWLPLFKTWPGYRTMAVDSRNRLLFAINYLQGFIDVKDLDSGEHVGYLLANAKARYIGLDPVHKRGVVTTHGYGLYQFEYGDFVRGQPSP